MISLVAVKFRVAMGAAVGPMPSNPIRLRNFSTPKSLHGISAVCGRRKMGESISTEY